MRVNCFYAFSTITYYQNTLILKRKKLKRNGEFEEIKHGI